MRFAFPEVFVHLRRSIELLYDFSVVAADVFDGPCLHGRVLREFERGLARKAFFDERKQHGLPVPYAQREGEAFSWAQAA